MASRDWLEAHGVTHGPWKEPALYWKAVYYMLEESACVLLVNAAHKNRSGPEDRCEGLASGSRSCWSTGCCAGSFVPPPFIRDLRDLTRYGACHRGRTREANRLHKLLQEAGIKLASVAWTSSRVGPGDARRLAQGTTDADVLADLARGKLRRKLPALRQALLDVFGPITPSWPAKSWPTWTISMKPWKRSPTRIGEVLLPFAAVIQQLDTIPGYSTRR